MKKSKEDMNIQMTAEEIVKYIKESEEMKKPPKKRLYYKTKIAILLSLILGLLLLFTIFIWKPFEYKIDFNEARYNIYGYDIVTNKNKSITVDGKLVYIDENIVSVVPYKNYKDIDSIYIALLSEYGNVYSYNIESGEIYKYNHDLNSFKIANIESKKLDIYDVVEVSTNKNKKYILTCSGFYEGSCDDLKTMDKLIYESRGNVIYLKSGSLYICNYDKLNHFSVVDEKEVFGNEVPRVFTEKLGNDIKYIDVVYKEYEDKVYVYGITDDFKLTIYTLDMQDSKLYSLPNKIEVDKIEFNKKLEKFTTDYNSEFSVRILTEGKMTNIEIILDKVIIGSLSNDETLFTYSFDLNDGTIYTAATYDGVYVRYDKTFYTCLDKGKIECAFLDNHSNLNFLVFNTKNNEVIIKQKKLDNSLSLEKIYNNSGKLYAYIKEIVKNEYVVFDDETNVVYHEYLVEDFVSN